MAIRQIYTFVHKGINNPEKVRYFSQDSCISCCSPEHAYFDSQKYPFKKIIKPKGTDNVG